LALQAGPAQRLQESRDSTRPYAMAQPKLDSPDVNVLI
jgi:hypothetical protein